MNRIAVRFASSSAARKALIEKIVRVDHAGELGADRIYAGQMAVLGGKPVGQVIKKMWEEEKEHLDTMERLAAKHDVPVTVFSPIFSVAAYALGEQRAKWTGQGESDINRLTERQKLIDKDRSAVTVKQNKLTV